MPKITIATIVQLVVWSLVVGAVLAFFDITPLAIWHYLSDRVRDLVENFQGFVGKALTYILLGAVIVVPIWLLSYLFKALKSR